MYPKEIRIPWVLIIALGNKEYILVKHLREEL